MIIDTRTPNFFGIEDSVPGAGREVLAVGESFLDLRIADLRGTREEGSGGG
jgi:hypothetical protein